MNNVRLQDFKTQELVATYQQKVLSAAQEVENGLVAFWAPVRAWSPSAAAVRAAERAVKLVGDQFLVGAVDFTPVFVARAVPGQTQTEYAQAQGDIALGLIEVDRALGGGGNFALQNRGADREPTSPAFRDGDPAIPPVPRLSPIRSPRPPAPSPSRSATPSAARSSDADVRTRSPGGRGPGREP